MLLINQLDHILGQASKVRMLRFLINTGAEFNGREIASAVGFSHVKAHTALRELYLHGVIVMHRSGRSILYHINEESIIVKKLLRPLFEREAHLGGIIAEIMLKNIKPPLPKSIILFGSFASGSAKPDSDIDILIIPSGKKDSEMLNKELEMAEQIITNQLGNRLACVIIGEKDFKKRFRKKEELITNIVRHGKVIFGSSIAELIKYGS